MVNDYKVTELHIHLSLRNKLWKMGNTYYKSQNPGCLLQNGVFFVWHVAAAMKTEDYRHVFKNLKMAMQVKLT